MGDDTRSGPTAAPGRRSARAGPLARPAVALALAWAATCTACAGRDVPEASQFACTGELCGQDASDAALAIALDAAAADAATVDATSQRAQDSRSGAAAGTALIAAGTFAMGCNLVWDTACAADEQPQHVVELSAFRIDLYETTVDRYTACMNDGGCSKPVKTRASHGAAFHFGASGAGNHPVNGVSWSQAKAFCAWAGGRLPTEAEWERAARGGCELLEPGTCLGATFVFPWGHAAANCELAVMADGGDGCGTKGTWPVGSKPQGNSPYGLFDMAGNVWEWVADYWAVDWYQLSAGPDPTGPATGTTRVMRGGSLAFSADYLRASSRGQAAATDVDADLGFRCVYGPAQRL